jgi:hypothetical protein
MESHGFFSMIIRRGGKLHALRGGARIRKVLPKFNM